MESLIPSVNFCARVRFLGVILDDDLQWKGHVKEIRSKCAQRMYILRRVKNFVTDAEFLTVYCGLIRSLLEYACPVFIGISGEDLLHLEILQKRCLKIKGNCRLQDLSSRRERLAVNFFRSAYSSDTAIKSLLPSVLPSGRLSVPYSRTTIRRKSFIPLTSIIISSTFCD